MEELLVSYLLAYTALTGLVSNRVHWNLRPQIGAIPAVALSKTSRVTLYDMDGPAGLASDRVQVDCWAASFGSAIAVSRAINARLSGAKFADTTVTVQGCFLDAERHFVDDEGAERLYRISMDFIIWHTE